MARQPIATRAIHRIKKSSAMRFRLLPCVVMVTTSTILALLTMTLIAWSSGLRIDQRPPASEENVVIEVETTENLPEHVQLLMADPEEEVRHFDTSLGERDQSQRYVKHLFVVMATEWKDMAEATVGLATHASLDHLHHLVGSADAWTGPISVAVFTPDIEYQLARIYIRYLRACFPEIRRKVSFHLVYPVERPARWEDGPLGEAIADCEAPARAALAALLARRPPAMLKAWRNELPYPQNLMRNLARFTCPGEYLLCPDVDMVATLQGLDGQLAEFLERPQQRTCERCAYVVPVYEVREGEHPPANKSELLRLVKRKKAQPFHLKVFRPNQGLSNLALWEKAGQRATLNVSHKVEKFAFFFEPVYVAPREVPPFDERFVGFGHTRNTQAYEMFVAGWQFSVLNNAFLVHWGVQNASSRPPWRKKQAASNSRRFPSFAREIAIRYDKDPLNMLSKYGRGKYKLAVVKNIPNISAAAPAVPVLPAAPAAADAPAPAVPAAPSIAPGVAAFKAPKPVVEPGD